jgi:PAS domain S-box-containing protein
MLRGFADWAAVAELVADEGSKPVLLLDGAGIVQLINRVGLELVGARREQIVGRHFRELFLNPGDRDRFKDALRGAIRRIERQVRTIDGRQLRVLLDLSPVGGGKRKGLVITVTSSTPVDGEALPEDLDYEICSDLSDFGRLQHVVAEGKRVPYLAGRPCWEALRSARTVCSDCPALRPTGDWPRVVVRRASDASAGYEIVAATPHGRFAVRLKVRRFTAAMLAAVFDARIAELAEQADLTERERGVFRYLIMGRHLSDIATILEISSRTVKFHQGNILRKLGADSRVDLMRLMM